jgi:hypothetical protein
MSRFPADDGPMQWMEGLPEKELYDIYADTIATRFPAFGVRGFERARVDMAQTLHPHDPSRPIDQALVDIIVTPESHERFTEDLERFIRKHGLRGWIEYGESLLFVTDHGQFTDVPVVAETLGRIGLADRTTTVQVVSEMISLLKLDLGQGEFDVIGRLRNVSAVVQTVPRVDGHPSEGLERYRERKNDAGLTILGGARDTEGSMTVASLVARHNTKSKNGNTLFIHEPNRRTLEGYTSRNVKVVPVCIDCPTFSEDGGVAPADMQFEFFPPMQIDNPRRDTRAIVDMFKEGTQRMVGDRYKHGVKVRSWNAQMAAQRVNRAIPHPNREPADPTAEY